MGGTGPDTGWFQIVFSSNITEVTLGHLSVFRELRRPKRTGELATVASHTQIAIDNNGTVFLSAGNRPGWTDDKAGCVTAVLAGERKMNYARLRILPFFIFSDMTKSDLIIGNKIVLVLTGNDTGHATGAP